MKTKYTAAIRQKNAARWFQWSPFPWNIKFAINPNTISDITSWMTFSWTSVKGPPLSINPILFAGTWQQYSKNAMAQLNAITPIKGQLLLTPDCCNFKCPYHANVTKTLLHINNKMLYIVFIYPFNSFAMLAAALRPSPIANITVAPPRTMSPPA